MAPRTDAQLVRAARKGRADAVDELFSRYWLDAWQAAYVVVGDRTTADDVAQEAITRAFGALASFDPSRSFGAWLHRIVVNRAIDQLRARRTHRSIDEDVVDGAPPGWLEELAAPQPLLEALAQLSPERRAVVVLRFWFGYDQAETARILDVPVGTAKSRLSRALDDLRAALEVSDRDRAR